MAAVKNAPGRGQIWFVQLPVDPPDKGKRPVVIVSLDARNRHERADTVLVIPLSTSIHKANHPTHLFLAAGESGLSEDSIARAEDITVIRKVHLIEPRSALRTLSHRRVCELAEMVKVAMGCL
jgi:mRNA-degrading endonuclease toxin of MazEF toxin-antitoxin module